MDESLMIIESDPEILPSDKWLCQLARAQRIAEDVHIMFSFDDPMVKIPVEEWSIQVKGFNQRLSDWRKTVTPDMPESKILYFLLTSHITNLVPGNSTGQAHRRENHAFHSRNRHAPRPRPRRLPASLSPRRILAFRIFPSE